MSAPSGRIRTLGIYGAGKSGTAIARQALAAGYAVRVATSGPAERIALVASVVMPGVSVVDADQLGHGCDAVVLAVPLRSWRKLALHLLEATTVVDVMNYWPPVDGVLGEFEVDDRPTSQVVRDGLPGTARLVKALNHVGYHEIEELARPAGSTGRVAVAIAGDDEQAVVDVAHLVDDLGFDPVVAGGLADSAALQPGSPVFGADLAQHALRAALGLESEEPAAPARRPAPAPVLTPQTLTLLAAAPEGAVCDLNGACA